MAATVLQLRRDLVESLCGPHSARMLSTTTSRIAVTTRWSHWLRTGLAVAVLSSAGACSSSDHGNSGGGTAIGGTGGSASGSGGTAGSGGAATGGDTASGGAGAGGQHGEDVLPLEGDRRIPFTPDDDLAFAQFFIEHHRMAIHMAEAVVARGEDATVRALAEQIVATQSSEVETLETVEEELLSTGEPLPPTPTDPHSEAEMEAIAELSGAELDRMFLVDMIQHHAAGVPPAHRAMPRLARQDTRSIAAAIVATQAREIGRMRLLLTELNHESSGQDEAPATEDRPDFGLIGDRRIPLTPVDDTEFVDFFISHHEMAMMMAEQVVERGSNAEVKALAQRIVADQTSEVQTMKAARLELEGDDEPPPMPADPHGDPEMHEMMQASGGELDRMFLEEMIPHHAAGLPTAHRARPHVIRPELSALAINIFLTQAQEIGEMHELLGQLE